MNAGQSGMEPPLPANGYARQGSADASHDDADLDTLLAGQPLDMSLKRELEHLDSIDLDTGIGRRSGSETRESTPGAAVRNPLAAHSPDWDAEPAGGHANEAGQMGGSNARNEADHTREGALQNQPNPSGHSDHTSLSADAGHSDSGSGADHAASIGASAPTTPMGAAQNPELLGEIPDLPLITAMEDDGANSANRVSAYARLDFESFTFYVQTLQVVLGRKPEHGGSQADVDVHLGPAKAISRRHAKIFYNFATQRFELTVIGRNGAFVGDVFVETGSTVPLRDSTKVQIGQIAFNFVLPLQGDERETGQNTPLEDEVEIEETGSDSEEHHHQHKKPEAKGSKIGSEKGRGGKLKQRTQSQTAKAKPAAHISDKNPHPLAPSGAAPTTASKNGRGTPPVMASATSQLGASPPTNSRPPSRPQSQTSSRSHSSSHSSSHSNSQSSVGSNVQPNLHPLLQPQPQSQSHVQQSQPRFQSPVPSLSQQQSPSHPHIQPQAQQSAPAPSRPKPKPKPVKKEDENNLFAQTSADQAVESAIASLPEMAGFRSDSIQTTHQPASQNHATSELEGLNALLQNMPGFPDRGGNTGQPAAAPQPTVPGYTNVQDLPELQPGLLGHPDNAINTGNHHLSENQQWSHANQSTQVPQSLQGLQGLQSSLQSLQGLQGLQGIQGLQGLQGLEGLQNLQSLLGLPGFNNMQPAPGLGSLPQMPQSKPLQQKQKRKPKREYRPDEIPEQYRTKPSHSYSHLITAALRDRLPVMPDGTPSGLSLADIYEAIMDLFPYYRYCAPGWQNSVRHNLSSSKSFRKVSKEGKGWLWGLDEAYLAEKEKQRQRALARQQQQALAQQQAMAQQQAREQAREQARLAQLARDREREAEQRQILAERAQRAARAGVPLHTLNATLGMSFKPTDAPSLEPPAPPQQPARTANPTVLPAETVKLLAGLQQHVQQKLASEGQPPLNPQLLSNALAVVIAQTAKKAGGLQHLASVLQQPDAVQKLLTQAMQLLRSTQRVPSAPGSSSSTPVTQSPQPEPRFPEPSSTLPSEAQVKAQPHVQSTASQAPVPSQHAQPHILQPQAPISGAPASAQPSQTGEGEHTPAPNAQASQLGPQPNHTQVTKVDDAGSPVVVSVQSTSSTEAAASLAPSAQLESKPVAEQPAQGSAAAAANALVAPNNARASSAPEVKLDASQAAPPSAAASPQKPAAAEPAVSQPGDASQQTTITSHPDSRSSSQAAEEAARSSSNGSTQQAKPAKKPPSLEKISEILAKAEAIPNPTPEVKGMIEKLKTHKRQLELKRSAETALPSSSAPDAPAPKRQAVE